MRRNAEVLRMQRWREQSGRLEFSSRSGTKASETLQRPAEQLDVHPNRPLLTSVEVIEEDALCCDA